ncbi:MAG: universal stress protein [Pseudomonadota bacterium]
MTLNRLLLVIVDPEKDPGYVIERARNIALKSGAEIELFASCFAEHLAGGRFFESRHLVRAREAAVAEATDKLETLAHPLREAGLNVSTHACWARPGHEVIGQRVAERNADLVIGDCEFHTAISRAIFSYEDWQLIRTCPSSVLLVKRRSLTESEPVIWAAVDPMQQREKPESLDRQILTVAQDLAKTLGGTLDVVHTYDPAAAVAAAAGPAVMPAMLPAEEIAETMRKEHERHLFALTDSFGIDRERVHNLSGSARQALPTAVIRNNTDLLVMGAVARTGLDKLMFGSSAEKLLDHVPCDILVVKPDEVIEALKGKEPQGAYARFVV